VYEFDIGPTAKKDPWHGVDFNDRYAAMCQKSGQRVAYFYPAPDTSTFRYRCWNMAETLNRHSANASAGCFYMDEAAKAEQVVDAADVVVLCRVMWDQHVGRIIALARAKKRRLLFDIDDMLFDPSTIYFVMRALGVNKHEDDWQFWFGMAARYQAVLKACDGAIGTTAALASMLQEAHPDGEVTVVPNFLNGEQISVSRKAMKLKSRQQFASDGSIHVGYFSGTPTHAKDFAVAEHALARLLAENPAIRLLMVGFIDPGAKLAPFAERIDRHDLVDYRRLQILQARSEISIAPLQPSPFTNCKSELKWFEAAVAGSISVTSPTDPFKSVIEDGKNGFLAPTGGWYEKLSEAVEHVGDADFVTSAAANAEKNRGWETVTPLIENALFGE